MAWSRAGCALAALEPVPIVTHPVTNEPAMFRIARRPLIIAIPLPRRRWGAWLRCVRVWWAAGDDERFLCDAADIVDLERRLRLLERGRGDRFRPLPPAP